MVCGATGGIAATFKAPIAGAIVAIEVILKRLHTLCFEAVVVFLGGGQSRLGRGQRR